jgi:predicted nucleic acid-binding protein
MTFADLAVGDAVFIDANIFVYHFIADPDLGGVCTSLLERLERKELEGWCSPSVLLEVAHRLMTIEACTTFGWPYKGIAGRLQKHPQEVQQLGRYRQALTQIALLGLSFVLATEQHVLQAADLSCQYGLLTNDALVIALMQRQGLTHVASNDADFDLVPSITRYAPI